MNQSRAFLKINRLIKKATNIFIMGHKDLDLDAIGSAVGFYDYVRSKGKNAFIVMNDIEHEAGVEKVLNMVDEVHFIKSKDIEDSLFENSLLIMVDVNKKTLLQDDKILSRVSKIVIVDHHEVGDTTVTQADVSLISKEASSASELAVRFLYFFDYQIRALYASFLLAGITLDTNSFSVRTKSITHYVSYYLLENGADVRFVNSLLKQDIEEYILRQKVITDLEVINKTIAFVKGSNRIIYKREELAKIADTLLEFDDIETSYVIGKLENNVIGISARSLGEINVGNVLSLLGGGGDRHDAACQIENKTLKEVEVSLKKILGEIE